MNDGIGKTDFKTDSFLMIGQSNMAGRGDFGEVPEIVNDKCFMLRMGRWQFMSEPINPDRYIFGGGFHSGISLAASFANKYAEHFNRQVGLIPCADGGTTVKQWQPGSILFDHCVMQAKLAMRSSELRGILWHQGESDCDSDENLEMYEERVRRVLCGIREQLGMSQLPIIIGEISYNISEGWNTNRRHIEFNRRLPEIAKKIGNCAVVSSKDLSLKSDGIHFNSESLREFGIRYFNEYLKLVGNN
ncbi:MAG: sialate O-acetylesterase [bacterium]|nr:sialate O-acetylesterase [bacterium]